MPLPTDSGVVWYVAPPLWGKTFKALRDASALINTTGRPLVCIDSQGVKGLSRIRHYDNVADLCIAVWQRGENAAIIPESSADVDKIALACRSAGDVILLVDESSYWITSSKRNSQLLRLMRAHQHARCHILLTTQHFSGDLPQEALSCSPTIYAGPVRSPAALSVLERWYGVTPDMLAQLSNHDFLELSLESRPPLAKSLPVPGGNAAAGGTPDPPEVQ